MPTRQEVYTAAEASELSKEELPYFMAQMDHETCGFKYMHELGGPSYFAKYDGRKDLGNTEPGDGYRFRGRGLIQLTGRANYKTFGDQLGINLISNPELAAQLDIALKIAILYWKQRVPECAIEDGDVVAITRAINGGLNGLRDRESLTDKYLDGDLP